MSFGRKDFEKIAAHIKANPITGLGQQHGNRRHVLFLSDAVRYAGWQTYLSEITDLQNQWIKSSLLAETGFGNPIELASMSASQPDEVYIEHVADNPVWQKSVVEGILENMAQRL
ncbi:MAG TPA: hypothetical protein DEA55_11230 [Rhodospirillaceae bacterium]|nr:hypothetical protein [Rhodospirillaceae bacterium]